jgi:hypothetical protein
VQDRQQMMDELQVGTQRREMWWLCLLGVIVLLGGETWMTRMLVRRRS